MGEVHKTTDCGSELTSKLRKPHSRHSLLFETEKAVTSDLGSLQTVAYLFLIFGTNTNLLQVLGITTNSRAKIDVEPEQRIFFNTNRTKSDMKLRITEQVKTFDEMIIIATIESRFFSRDKPTNSRLSSDLAAYPLLDPIRLLDD